MKLKKLLCTAFLALSWCATSAAAVTQEDIDFARSEARLRTPLRGRRVLNGTLAAQRQYYTQTRDHLRAILNMDFEAYRESSGFLYDLRTIPVLNRYYDTPDDLNADNFKGVVRDAISLMEHLIAQTAQIAPN